MKNFFNTKLLIAMLIDFFLGGISFNTAIYIRLNYIESIGIETIFACFLLPITFIILNIYKRPWRYFSTSDLWPIVKACLIANVLTFLFLFILNRMENIPRLVVILNFFTLIFLAGSARVIYRTLFEKLIFFFSQASTRIPILLIGDGDRAETFIRSTERRNGIYQVVGIINEDEKKNKEIIIRGIPILGSLKDLKQVLDNAQKTKKEIQKIIILTNSIKGSDMSNIMKLVDKRGMTVGRAPSPNEVISDKMLNFQIRDISLEDLLGRRQNRLEYKRVKGFLKNETVLVTGAGGSIGRQLAKTIAQFSVKKLILIDISENSVYKLGHLFTQASIKKKAKLICCDVRDRNEMKKIFFNFKPSIIYHAAALKHVSICEENVSEAIKINAIATNTLAELAEIYKSKCFVLISTDKAVSPSSVMGSTKKIAENIIQSKDRFSKYKTRFITVRFGNVLGSQGSVVPLFKNQIEKGGPVTVTSKNVSRFFMTIEEAVGLVLNATIEQYNTNPNFRGCVSVLNMGASIKIDILAKQMIKVAGFTPNKEIKIEYIGLKKGEKMHEKLYGSEEEKIDIGDKGFFFVKSKITSQENLKKTMANLKKSCDYSNNRIKENLFRLINK